MSEKGQLTAKDLVRLSPELWAEQFGYVRNVSGKKVPFKLNVLQRRIFALWRARNLRGLPVRVIGLKPRKRGFSTAVAALHYAQLSRNIHEGVIIGDKLDTSDIVFRMVNYFAETDEFGGWGSPVEATSEKIKWQHGSRISQATARGKATCRGMTPQFMHLTEAAHFENAEDAMDAAMNAVPDDGFTTIFIESTPFGAGEPFALKWEGARWPKGWECPGGEEYWRQWESFCPDVEEDALSDRNFVRVFAAWYEFEESRIRLTDAQKREVEASMDGRSWYDGERELIRLYGNEGPRGLRLGREVVDSDVWEQLAWRRMTIRDKCRGAVRVYNAEHPGDPKTCFLSAGRQVFDADAMDYLTELSRKYVAEVGQLSWNQGRVTYRPTGLQEGNLLVWERPKVGCRYLVGVDPAEGEDQTKGADPDRHSVQVWRAEYMEEGILHLPRLVARVRPPCRVPMIPLATMVRDLSMWYGRCVVLPEMNNSGMALITALRMLADCPPIWQRREMDPHSGRERRWDGWRTTDTKEYGGVRSTIIWHLHEALRSQRLVIACPHVVSELRDFVDKGGRMEAGGGHDDDVLCCAMAVFNLDSATMMGVERREGILPPDLAKERRVTRVGLAMRS